MIKYTPAFQKKLEDIYHEGEYLVRYEKGSFNSGYCILEQKRVVVINRFHTIDSKINSLVEILNYVNLNEAALSEASRKLWQELKQIPEPTLL